MCMCVCLGVCLYTMCMTEPLEARKEDIRFLEIGIRGDYEL